MPGWMTVIRAVRVPIALGIVRCLGHRSPRGRGPILDLAPSTFRRGLNCRAVSIRSLGRPLRLSLA